MTGSPWASRQEFDLGVDLSQPGRDAGDAPDFSRLAEMDRGPEGEDGGQ